MSSSNPPAVVTITEGIFNLINCAKNPLNPDVTIFDVKVKKIFADSFFIFTITSFGTSGIALAAPTGATTLGSSATTGSAFLGAVSFAYAVFFI